MTIDDELLEIFREETQERLDRIVDCLLAVESGQGGGDTDESRWAGGEAVASLFRDAHSIKGNAGMVGLDEVRVIAHAMEDVLDGARAEGRLAPELVEPLLRSADAIRRALAGETGVAHDVVAALTLLGPAVAAAPAADEDADLPLGATPQPAAGGPAADRRSLRVAAEKVDRLLDAVGETVLHHRRVEHLLESRVAADEALEETFSRGEHLLDELQDSVIRMRTLPLSSITGTFPRAVRDIARAQGKELELVITGAETQLDRVILDGITETITHLLRNAVSHGIELPEERERAGKPRRGRIDLSAEQRGGMVEIAVSDDGRGVPARVLEEAREAGSLTDVLAAPGFSTAAQVTDLSGRGVGLDAVKTHVESLGGSVEVTSEAGAGTRVVLLLPLTLALLRVLLIARGGHPFGIPLASVQEAMTVTEPRSLAGSPSVELRGASVPLSDLADVLGATAPELAPRPPGVVVTSSQHRAVVMCDHLLGEEEVVIKNLGLLAGVPGYLGAAILGDGRVALVLDPAHLARARGRRRMDVQARAASAVPIRILVVDDQFTVRELQRSILETAGYDVVTAGDGREALDLVNSDGAIDLVVTDIQMPEMDGFAMLESIRADERHRALPVVVVTSLSSQEQRRRGAELGADAYIVKEDFNQQALLETIARLVGH